MERIFGYTIFLRNIKHHLFMWQRWTSGSLRISSYYFSRHNYDE